MYFNLYELIMYHIYNGNTTPEIELVCTFVATTACLFLMSLPFVVVYKLIKALANI